MFLQAKHPPVVKTDALENSVAIKQPVIEDRDLRFALRVKFSVDINLRLFRRRRACASFSYRLNCCFASLRLVNHDRVSISGFHTRRKISGESLCNSRAKIPHSRKTLLTEHSVRDPLRQLASALYVC